MINVSPLTGNIGAEIDGVDLANLTDQIFNEICGAILRWKVVFLRNQNISFNDQLSFAKRFGEIEIHPLTPKWQKDAQRVEIVEDKDKKANNDIWHTDLTFKANPSLGSILRAKEIPDSGGDTLFADMEAAYNGLDKELKVLLDTSTAVHDFHPFRADMRGNGTPESVIDAFRRKLPPVSHPVFRTHPVTGRKSIFVNPLYTKSINGFDDSESDKLLNLLFAKSSVPEYQVRFKWEVDSVAIWDNRCTQHYAVSDYRPKRRVVERVSVCGDNPF